MGWRGGPPTSRNPSDRPVPNVLRTRVVGFADAAAKVSEVRYTLRSVVRSNRAELMVEAKDLNCRDIHRTGVHLILQRPHRRTAGRPTARGVERLRDHRRQRGFHRGPQPKWSTGSTSPATRSHPAAAYPRHHKSHASSGCKHTPASCGSVTSNGRRSSPDRSRCAKSDQKALVDRSKHAPAQAHWIATASVGHPLVLVRIRTGGYRYHVQLRPP